MSARVQQNCMQCVNGIRSERGEECKRARIVCNARTMAYGARRGVHACERIVCNARMAYGARCGVHACERIACNAEWGPSLIYRGGPQLRL